MTIKRYYKIGKNGIDKNNVFFIGRHGKYRILGNSFSDCINKLFLVIETKNYYPN